MTRHHSNFTVNHKEEFSR